ncbi:MAG: nucleotidyltransferase domain-containing protein [Cyclobacteriaceae bacterium]
MTSNHLLSQFKLLAESYFEGLPVLLAGSYATNTQSSDSDVDLIVFTDKVNHPVISGKELNGYAVELIEMPLHNPIYYLEKTATNSGAYITMLYTGKIIQDRDNYLAKVKEWAEGIYLGGPQEDGRLRKIQRYLIEITHLLQDLEGNKPALEKFFAATQAVVSLNNMMFKAHNLWPMGGKWATRTLDGLYADYTRKLALGMNKGIEKGDFNELVELIDGYTSQFGGRMTSYSTTTLSHWQPQEVQAIQLIAPGVYLATTSQLVIAKIMALRERYPDIYLKTYEEGQGSLGIVVPSPKPNDTAPYDLFKQAVDGTVMYSTEPTMQLIYGGNEAIQVTDTYFKVVTNLAAGLKEITENTDTWHKQVLSQCAYLFPVFCVQMGIKPDKAGKFSAYLLDSWYPESINPDGYLMPEAWLAEQVNLTEELQQKVAATDTELLHLIGSIMSDPDIRFDVDLFDEWADGLQAVSEGLHDLSMEGKLQTYSLTETDVEGIWPILKSYLDHLYTLLDVPHKDRLYLVTLLKEGTKA